MDATLEYCGNKIVIKDFQHYEGDEELGNPFNCSFDIFVLSGCFQGYAYGCEYDYRSFRDFVRQLKELLQNLSSQAKLEEAGYGSEILFAGDGQGHIEVSGIVYGEAMTQALRFSFMTDQTVYQSFVKELESLI